MDDLNSKVIESAKETLDELEASYWVPLLRGPFDALDEMLKRIEHEPNPLRQPLRAFRSNLAAAKELLEFPYVLLLPFMLNGTEVEKQLAGKSFATEAEVESVLQDVELTSQIYSTIMRGTSQQFRKQPLPLTRLMHQACLLAWSAYETFCKEVFIAALDRQPKLYGALMRNQALKDKFSISTGGWQSLLEKSGYDLNGKLGKIVGSDRDFSSPQLLKDLFPALLVDLPGPAMFNDAMSHPSLWLLGNRRHLIAHRCGIVDEEYLRKCDDQNQATGQLLALRGRDVAEGLRATASAAMALYGKARHCWDDPATLSQG